MRTALIGSTGFVGTTLRRQHTFTDHFHSPTIARLPEAEYDLIVCAGAPAAKWKANADPEWDRANLATLTDALVRSRARSLVLISTVDVYPRPIDVDEATAIDEGVAQPYGRHRRELERTCLDAFANATVLRLPALFGSGLRKNFVYDLLEQPQERFTHHRSVFQFYDMGRLWTDIEAAAASDHRILNLVTEPVSAAEVASHAFGVEYDFSTEDPPVRYDVRTLHAEVFGGSGSYTASKGEVLDGLGAFVKAERAGA